MRQKFYLITALIGICLAQGNLSVCLAKGEDQEDIFWPTEEQNKDLIRLADKACGPRGPGRGYPEECFRMVVTKYRKSLEKEKTPDRENDSKKKK